MPPCRLRRRKFWKCDCETVHSEVYLNKYVVSIASFSTCAYPDCSKYNTKYRKLLFLHVLAFYFFNPFFYGGLADPFCPYVRTPMSLPISSFSCDGVCTLLQFLWIRLSPPNLKTCGLLQWVFFGDWKLSSSYSSTNSRIYDYTAMKTYSKLLGFIQKVRDSWQETP